MTVPKTEDKDHQPKPAAGVESGTESLEYQRDLIKKLNKKPLVKGDTWYLLEHKWFKQWKKYVGYDNWETANTGEPTANPGPIDNSALLKDSKNPEDLREHLIDELDYALLPEEGWEKLVEWYGMVPNQSPIARTVVDYGMFLSNLRVEIYRMELKVCLHPNIDDLESARFSKVATLDEVEKKARALFSVPDDANTRLWSRFSTNTLEMITDKSKTIQDESLYNAQVILLEVQNADGTWPRSCPSSGGASGTRALTYVTSPTGSQQNNAGGSGTNAGSGISSVSQGGSYRLRDPRTSRATSPGLCGLSNLGNTCFMNAALQCMSNTPPLTDYFLSDKYQNDLNRENPLGMNGEIALAYGEMIKVLWSGNHQTFTPRGFKEKVGRFAPQFHGYMQQDCQELMSFLLDGLHEDLNRVKRKPYIEAKSADGRSDRVLAKEAWTNYLKRNDSIVTDTFHGLLKSTLVCPDCKHVSVTFDPSCFLSLPLPHRKDKLINATAFLNDPRRPCKLRLYVPVYPTKCTGNDFYSIVSKLTQVPAENLVAANMDTFDKRIKFIIEPNDEEIEDITDTMYIYELPASPWTKDGALIRVYTRELADGDAGEGTAPTTTMFGYPFYLFSPTRQVSVDDLYDLALDWLQGRFVKSEANEGDQGSDDEEPMDAECAADTEQAADKENGPHVANRLEDSLAPLEQAGTNSRRRKRLFKVSLVNEMCNTSLTPLASRATNGTPEPASTTRSITAEDLDSGSEKTLTLTKKSYLALDWSPSTRQAFYEECTMFQAHPSSSTVTAGSAKRPVTLWECLKLFTTTEKLGAEDLWYCPNCKKHQQATKKFDLWSLPNVLIIHLKRFSYNRYFRDKIDTLVDFPITGLKMGSAVLDPKHTNATYDLIGVANHYGGMGGGHYTAYAKNKLTNTWHHFDDANVSPCREKNIVSKSAYVLFYERRDSGESRSCSNGTDRSSSTPSPTSTTTRAQRRSVAQRNSSTPDSDDSKSSNQESEGMDY